MEGKSLNRLGFSDPDAEYKPKPTGRPNPEDHDITSSSSSPSGPEENDDETFNPDADDLVDDEDEETTESENELAGKTTSNLGPQPETDPMTEELRLAQQALLTENQGGKRPEDDPNYQLTAEDILNIFQGVKDSGTCTRISPENIRDVCDFWMLNPEEVATKNIKTLYPKPGYLRPFYFY